MRGPATTIIRSAGTSADAFGNAAITRSSSARPTPDPPTVTTHTCSPGPVPELRPQALAVAELGRIEAADVAGEVVVAVRPVGDGGQARTERVGHDVLAIADEDRPVAHAREALDLLDHLGVVVGGQEGLALAAVGERQPADEVGQPHVRRALLLGVLMQVVVDLPPLVGDPQVVVLLAHDVVEHHEVRHQDLVHPAYRLEAVQVVLGRLRFDVP